MMVAVLGILTVQYEQFLALREVARAMAEVPANALVTSWKSGGVTVSVTTTRGVGESDDALLVRHTKEVQAKLKTHPIDPA